MVEVIDPVRAHQHVGFLPLVYADRDLLNHLHFNPPQKGLLRIDDGFDPVDILGPVGIVFGQFPIELFISDVKPGIKKPLIEP